MAPVPVFATRPKPGFSVGVGRHACTKAKTVGPSPHDLPESGSIISTTICGESLYGTRAGEGCLNQSVSLRSVSLRVSYVVPSSRRQFWNYSVSPRTRCKTFASPVGCLQGACSPTAMTAKRKCAHVTSCIRSQLCLIFGTKGCRWLAPSFCLMQSAGITSSSAGLWSLNFGGGVGNYGCGLNS